MDPLTTPPPGTPQPLNNLQLAMLKVLPHIQNEEDLTAIRDMIGKFLLERARQRATEADAERNYADEDYERMLNDPS